ncbi:methylase [Bellilinea caldifistulae]|uniref:class I SAM-dependent DNA methyltransferase n=1 Tax=Bellilinea caldifistulae TaxID=360411 RepID=UPI000784E69B|nr:class I SAM-dependent methyltransferase [Bellilinea caldifistulae]GAP09289.1 methylase [Bellilinea caldifistulae]
MEVNGLFTPGEFDRWAENYDSEVERGQGLPFEGYAGVLERVFQRAGVRPGLSVLDLGCGTGNLTARFVQAGCRVWGSDFSAEMLKIARRKVPGARFFQHQLGNPLPADVPQHYARMVSAYVFHHFDQAGKIALLTHLRNHLEPGGWIVIGDIAFPNAEARQQAKQAAADAWDEEPYWLVEDDLPALRAAGFQAAFEPVSFCAGVFLIQPEMA